MPTSLTERIRMVCERVAGRMLDDGWLEDANRMWLRNEVFSETAVFVARYEAMTWNTVSDVVFSVEMRLNGRDQN